MNHMVHPARSLTKQGERVAALTRGRLAAWASRILAVAPNVDTDTQRTLAVRMWQG